MLIPQAWITRRQCDLSRYSDSAVPLLSPIPMATRSSRPLPPLPGPLHTYCDDSHFAPYPYPAYAPPTHDASEHVPPMLPAGTLLHKGFYDLLAMIPTPSPSRLFQWASNQPSVTPGPRYDPLAPATNPSPSPLKKIKRISKDMVSKPTGFVCVLKQ